MTHQMTDRELRVLERKWKEQERQWRLYLQRVRENAQNEWRFESMIKDCYAYYEGTPKYAVICIPGRANDGAHLAQEYQKISEIPNTVFVGPTPIGMAWYPMPYSATNQKEAVQGLPRARKAIEKVQQKIEEVYGIGKENTILTGFSAGGVMAIQVATHSDTPYKGVVCHSGAILDPASLPMCTKDNWCPILLMHNKDDTCFDWIERYIPMKTALLHKKYVVYTSEFEVGGHIMKKYDFSQGGLFMQNICQLGSPNQKIKEHFKLLKNLT